MTPIFKNVTTYTPKEYKEFLEFHGDKHNFSYFFFTIVFSLFLIFCAILQFSYHHISLGFLFIVILVGFLGYQILHPILFIKKEIKNGKISNIAKNTFSFFDKAFKVRNEQGVSKLKYSRLYRIYETNTHFYLYINTTYAFLISKKGFIIGKEEDFSHFLHRKVWYKYRKSLQK